MELEIRSLAVIGSINMDLSTRVRRLPRQGETLHGASFSFSPGGKGANQAVAAARLGARSVFAGRVGDDPFGVELTQALAQYGVDTEYLVSLPETRSGVAVIFLNDEGGSTILVSPGANFSLRPEEVHALTPVIAGADAVLLQPEIPTDTLAAVLKATRKHGTRSFLDCGPAQGVEDQLLALADLVSPNETEAETLTGLSFDGVDSAPAIADKLHAKGAREVVLKLGDQGAYYSGPDQRLHVPAFDVNVVDTTAAGDAFMAALALSWGLVPVEEALRRANGAGALAATRPGAQEAMPTHLELEQFLEDSASSRKRD